MSFRNLCIDSTLAREEAAAKLADSKLKLSPEDKAYYQKLAAEKAPADFALVDDISVPLEKLPAEVKFPESLKGLVWYVPDQRLLYWHGPMSSDQASVLTNLSEDSDYRWKIGDLYHMADYKRQLPPKTKVKNPEQWPGMILGEGVARIKKNERGQLEGRGAWLYRMPVTLTVMGIPPEGRIDFKSDPPEPVPYWVVDDSRTKVYQVDANTVYVSFDRLQKDLGMTAKQAAEDDSVVYPARTSEIDIKIKPDANLDATRKKIEEVCNAVAAGPMNDHTFDSFRVQTWEESNRVWLHAIENEKVLVMFLFGLISIVAVFLIFCIFYMIVVEKTRDIGIIKSVGATGSGVAGIFLGYGLAIGIVGAGMGLLLAWLTVHNINELHGWLGRAMGIVILGSDGLRV